MNTTVALVFWGVMTLVFLLVEAMTPQLLSVWFAVGSLAALGSAALGAPVWVQILVWLAVSAAALFAMRPISRRFRQRGEERLNANRIIGRHGIVVQTIDPSRAEGQIRIDGVLWSAKCEGEEPIAEGVRVKVLRIEGVKALVRVSRVQPEETEPNKAE